MTSQPEGAAATAARHAAGSACEWLLVTDGAPGRRFGGAALRWAALEKALASRGPGHWLRLTCQCVRAHQRAEHQEVPDTLFASEFCPAEMSRLLTALAGRPVLVVYSGIEMAEYLLRTPRSPAVEVVLDLHNSEAELCRELTDVGLSLGRRYSARRCTSLYTLEAACIARANCVWTCTEEDRMSILSAHAEAQKVPICYVPNAVEPASDHPADRQSERRQFERVLFLGRLDWLPNEIAARFLLDEVYPALASDFPDVTFVVAGAAARRRLAPGSTRNVRVVTDPQEVDSLWRGSVLAAPLTLGGGSRLKILEAFVRRVPVVATRKAVEGLAAAPGRHYVEAHSAEEFRSTLRALLAGAVDITETVRESFGLVRGRHSIAAVRSAIDESVPIPAATHRSIQRSAWRFHSV